MYGVMSTAFHVTVLEIGTEEELGRWDGPVPQIGHTVHFDYRGAWHVVDVGWRVVDTKDEVQNAIGVHAFVYVEKK